MSDLISRKYLYEKMMEKEELARQRVFDTPTHSPAYLRYVAQLNERTALKHEIADAPTVEAVPVVHGKWKYTLCGSMCSVCGYENKNELITRNRYDSPYCPHCGADMRKKV